MPLVLPSFLRHLSGLFLLTALVCLTACATHEQPPAHLAPAAPPPIQVPSKSDAKVLKPESKPTPRPRSRPPAMAAATPRSTQTPRAHPTPNRNPAIAEESGRAQTLGELIENGRFLRSEGNVYIFAKTELTNVPPSGLFEDAIILGRLRSRLNQIPGVPAGVSESATVKDAVAEFNASGGLSNAVCAKVIDVALTTEGVAMVRIRF